jgi:hypothetical protein
MARPICGRTKNDEIRRRIAELQERNTLRFQRG